MPAAAGVQRGQWRRSSPYRSGTSAPCASTIMVIHRCRSIPSFVLYHDLDLGVQAHIATAHPQPSEWQTSTLSRTMVS